MIAQRLLRGLWPGAHFGGHVGEHSAAAQKAGEHQLLGDEQGADRVGPEDPARRSPHAASARYALVLCAALLAPASKVPVQRAVAQSVQPSGALDEFVVA